MDDAEARNRAAMLQMNTFIAIITPDFIKEEKLWYMPIEASRDGKIMAAFILEGTEIPDRLNDLHWFGKYYFKDVSDISKISSQFIKEVIESGIDIDAGVKKY